MTDEDGHIGPINGHNKSEALPNGCFAACVAAIAFIFAMAGIGFAIDALKQ